MLSSGEGELAPQTTQWLVCVCTLLILNKPVQRLRVHAGWQCVVDILLLF